MIYMALCVSCLTLLSYVLISGLSTSATYGMYYSQPSFSEDPCILQCSALMDTLRCHCLVYLSVLVLLDGSPFAVFPQ